MIRLLPLLLKSTPQIDLLVSTIKSHLATVQTLCCGSYPENADCFDSADVVVVVVVVVVVASDDGKR